MVKCPTCGTTCADAYKPLGKPQLEALIAARRNFGAIATGNPSVNSYELYDARQQVLFALDDYLKVVDAEMLRLVESARVKHEA